MKKYAATLLALIILFSLLPLSNVFAEDSEQIVSSQYDKRLQFNNELMAVQKDGKWGLINKSGVIVAEPVFSYIGELSDGLALVHKDNKVGFLDSTGQIAIDPIFDDARKFSEGLAGAKLNGKTGYIDMTGSFVIESEIPTIGGLFSDGLARVYRNYKNGYINNSGEVVIKPTYDGATDFVNGIAQVSNNGEPYSFLIDRTGAIIRKVVNYSIIEKFSDKLIKVEKFDAYSQYGGLGIYGLIDNGGNIITEPEYRLIGGLSEGLARVQNKDGKWGFIDETGKVAIAPVFDGVSAEFSEGLAQAESNGKWGFINHEGQFVIEPRYDLVNNFKNGVAVVNNGWKFGNGLSHNGKYGFIDKEGKVVVDLSYDMAQNFDNEGLAVVCNERQYKIIDKSGNIVYKFENNAYDPLVPFSQKLMIAYTGNKFGFITNPIHPSTYPTSSKVKVNGKEIKLEVYNINGNNYFKLRDIATAINSTEKNFNVSYDAVKGTINITLNMAYSKVGGELAVSDTKVIKDTTLTTSKLLVNDKAVKLTAYNIDGNNYFKLRDIAQINNFGVTWDETTKTIGIDTKSVYEIDGKVVSTQDQQQLPDPILELAANHGFTLIQKQDLKDEVDYLFDKDESDSININKLRVARALTSDALGFYGRTHYLRLIFPTSDTFDAKQPTISLAMDIISMQINTDSSELFQKLSDISQNSTIDAQHPIKGKIKFQGVDTDYWLSIAKENDHTYNLEIVY